MNEVYDILEKIASTSSRNEKEAILYDNKNNEDLKNVIRMAYDPFINFWIRKIPDYKSSDDNSLEWGLEQLNYLANRDKTGNEGIAHLQYVLSKLNTKNASVLERVVLKDLRAGFAESTINEVWLKLIPEYPCMLCSTFKQKLIDKMEWPAVMQLKLDGMRFNAIVKDNSVEYRSRNGKLMDLKASGLDGFFLMMANGMEMVFDGELLVSDDHGGYLPRTTGNGILSKSIKGTISQKEVERVCSILWDEIPLDVFKTGTCLLAYERRFNFLLARWSSIKTDRIKIVETQTVENLSQAIVLYKEWLSKGQEGGILKNMNAPWEDKRSQNQIKFKAELECDLLCVGYEPGNGKYEGMIGNLLCESRDGIIHVGVGSGMKENYRKNLTPEYAIGKIVTVKYNARIKEKKTNQESLFLPVFVEIREDKDVPDYAKDIK